MMHYCIFSLQVIDDSGPNGCRSAKTKGRREGDDKAKVRTSYDILRHFRQLATSYDNIRCINVINAIRYFATSTIFLTFFLVVRFLILPSHV